MKKGQKTELWKRLNKIRLEIELYSYSNGGQGKIRFSFASPSHSLLRAIAYVIPSLSFDI